ncbi:MAG: hypothetical protein COA62_08120 [Rhodobiaceae bacterium]|nr:MAG: hypothetical protein COA62_08120 [Rhodobiaceae bacterium]
MTDQRSTNNVDGVSPKRPPFDVVAAVNNEQVLNANLLASPLLHSCRDRLVAKRGFSSAAAAYNAGLDETDGNIVVLVHQDVYFPKNWDAQLLAGIAAIEKKDPNWAIIGIYGVRPDGSHVGRVWSSGIERELGEAFDAPATVTTIDELVIVVNRRSGLRFDENLPGFHLYATDIALAAADKGRGVYVVHAPVVHNSVPVLSLSGAYVQAYKYLQKKWSHRLPIVTTVTILSRTGWSLWRTQFRLAGWDGARAQRRREELERRPRRDPGEVATMLGYERP